MAQMPVLFICWEGRQHNKSTLSFLSDVVYQKVFLPGYLTKKKLQFPPLITEKKVEIFHSLLQENTTEHNDAKSQSETAKVTASCGFLSAFKEGFIPLYHRGIPENKLSPLTGKTEESLLKLFQKILNNSGKAHKVCLCSKSKLIKGTSKILLSNAGPKFPSFN